MVDVQQFGGDAAHIVQVHLGEVVGQAGQVVVGEVVGDHAGELGDYPGLGLELGGKAAEDALNGVAELGLGYGAVADYLLELLEGLDDGLFGDGGLDAAARDQHGGGEVPIHCGHIAVAVSLVLAQVHVEARGELAAEDVVEQVERQVVGVVARDGEVAGSDDGLGGAGLVRDVDGGGRGFGGRDGGAGSFSLESPMRRANRRKSCSRLPRPRRGIDRRL